MMQFHAFEFLCRLTDDVGPDYPFHVHTFISFVPYSDSGMQLHESQSRL